MPTLNTIGIKFGAIGGNGGAVGEQPFIIQIDTSKTSTGSSTNRSFRLPTIATGTYNMTVDWGDGTSNVITVWNQVERTHTYATIGIYTVTITGQCEGWSFPTLIGTDRLKTLKVLRFGTGFKIKTSNCFAYNTNLTQVSTVDVPTFIEPSAGTGMFRVCQKLVDGSFQNWDVSLLTRMDLMFNGCFVFNKNINTWNTSNCYNMNSMFNSASIFNQPLDNWDTSNVEDMGMMFQATNAFNQNINTWNTSNCLTMANMFNRAIVFNQPLDNWDTSNVSDMTGMFMEAPAFNQNINTWNVSGVGSMASMFDCLGGVSGTFNQPLDNWDVSGCYDFTLMFAQQINFNQNINTWSNLGALNSNETLLSGMFASAEDFNQPLDNWDTSRVVDMTGMFERAISFNQDIGSWNVSSVLYMAGMFANAESFNQDIGSWNVSSVLDMTSMFTYAVSFNNGGSPSINNWNTSSCQTMFAMFLVAESFNQNIGSWDVTYVTDFGEMFNSARLFNNGGSPSINNWNTASATSMRYMFAQTNNFNQPIGNWTVSNVLDADYMFYDALAFNQPFSSSWAMPYISTAIGMFYGNTTLPFNQDLSNLHLGDQLGGMYLEADIFIINTSLTPANLDNIYNGWWNAYVSTGLGPQANFATDVQYTAAAAVNRDNLINILGWTIVDGGQV